MFERFTESARQVVVNAQDEARAFKHGYVGSEHLLLGILAEEEGLGWLVLDQLGVQVDPVREWVGRIVGPGETEAIVGQIPFSPHAKRAMELALREALSLGHNYVGTEHLLLGLSRGDEGVAMRILGELGLTADTIRDAVIRALESRPIVEPEPRYWEPRPGRCEQAFTLHGALFLCQKGRGHHGPHVEHGGGWVMSWDPE